MKLRYIFYTCLSTFKNEPELLLIFLEFDVPQTWQHFSPKTHTVSRKTVAPLFVINTVQG